MKLAVVFLGLLMAIAAYAADVTGKWKATIDGPQGQMEVTFDLKSDGHTLTGTSTGPMGESPITDGSVDGDKVTFTVSNGDFKAVHKGKVTGNEMKLTVDVGDQTLEMTAKRVGS